MSSNGAAGTAQGRPLPGPLTMPLAAASPAVGQPPPVAPWPERPAGPGRVDGAPASPGGRHAGAPHAVDQHTVRFTVFAAIGGSIFVAGLAIQAGLTGQLHLAAFASYLVQAVVSVEASFLLNRWLTWRDRDSPLWASFARFNIQKTVTVTANLVLYYGLLRLGMNYLVANVVLTVAFTVVNYVAGDRLVFKPGRNRTAGDTGPGGTAGTAGTSLAGRAAGQPWPARTPLPGRPRVSVVIPCRNNEATIRDAVLSILDQDYPALTELVLIGSPGDRTWRALADVTDPRLTVLETETPPGVRDANYKRDAGIGQTSGDLIALVDSDMVLPADWLSQAVRALLRTGASCVAGGMRSIHDSFWGRYTDTTLIGAKTPRIAESYTVSRDNFGARGHKPPITANTLFTRGLYEQCPIDSSWSHGSYEDYEWFWRVVRAGYEIHVCQDMFGWHHHRRGLRPLMKEYLRSSRGCAYFVRAHPASPLARRRRRAAVGLPVAAAAAIACAAAAVARGYSTELAMLLLGGLVLLSIQQVARSGRLEGAAYPVLGLALGLVFTMGLDTHLIRSGQAVRPGPADRQVTAGQPARRRPRPVRAWYPLAAICAVQAALSLTLVWSNTAFGDEAQYLWAGRVEWAHWLHGTPVPPYLSRLSGSPLIYPPLGALADSAGGLAGARIASLILMLGATVLLYLTAARLTGRTGAILAAALWALSEPALRLAFATFDPLSVFLTALAAFLAVQAGLRRRRGELVAAAAVALALANAAAYSGIVIDPVVIAFAALAWLPRMGRQRAAFAAAWLTAGLVACFSLIMTATHSWAGTASVFSRSSPDHQSLMLVISDIWQYSALIMGLAVVGVITAVGTESRARAALLALLAFAAFLVPAAQLHAQTAWSLDKHLAYGIWFAAMAAGYGISRLFRWLPGARTRLAMLCCAAALVYPAVSSWQLAWQTYHAWPDATSFIASIRPVVAGTRGLIYVAGAENVAQYYTPQGTDWRRWTGAIKLDLSPAPPATWTAAYAGLLDSRDVGVIALFYPTTFDLAAMPARLLLPRHPGQVYPGLLQLAAQSSGEPGLPALTEVLQHDPDYRLVTTGRYDTANLSGTHEYSVYAIWQRKAPG